MTRPTNWRKLGETALDIARVCAKAYEVYGERFVTFNAVRANPVQFAKAFTTALDATCGNHSIWTELMNQDWSDARIDINVVLNVNSESSRNSSFNSRSNFSAS